MNEAENIGKQAAALKIPLEHDLIMHTLIREVTHVLQEMAGTDPAAGFISVAGQVLGNQINDQYRRVLEVTSLSSAQLAAVLVNLKHRIRGDFFIIEHDDENIVSGNRLCPFENKATGQKTMYMMTSNIFGSISANNLGYAKVRLKETIAEGRPECRVVIYLKMGDVADAVEGREYFKSNLE